MMLLIHWLQNGREAANGRRGQPSRESKEMARIGADVSAIQKQQLKKTVEKNQHGIQRWTSKMHFGHLNTLYSPRRG